jgi:hypothetical protein
MNRVNKNFLFLALLLIGCASRSELDQESNYVWVRDHVDESHKELARPAAPVHESPFKGMGLTLTQDGLLIKQAES